MYFRVLCFCSWRTISWPVKMLRLYYNSFKLCQPANWDISISTYEHKLYYCRPSRSYMTVPRYGDQWGQWRRSREVGGYVQGDTYVPQIFELEDTNFPNAHCPPPQYLRNSGVTYRDFSFMQHFLDRFFNRVVNPLWDAPALPQCLRWGTSKLSENTGHVGLVPLFPILDPSFSSKHEAQLF